MPDYNGDSAWRDQAACAGTSDELWFPESDDVVPAAAQVICGRCPVRAACLTSALRTGEPYGVWGGTSPSERLALRRGLALAGPTRDEAA